MQSLKDIYNHEFILRLSQALAKHISKFDHEHFANNVFQDDWNALALKQRMRRITQVMHQMLPVQYADALNILYRVAPSFTGLPAIIFSDYIEQYGLNDWELSLPALQLFTTYSTAEFAVRPFILLNQDRMVEQFLEWSTDSNEHVRRLASEGSRPRLPWGMAIPSFKKDPTPILPILHALKEDPSLYVRKSVANNLNDISKTHPDVVLEIAQQWYGKNDHTDWIVKHACRTLLKKGDKAILSIFGYRSDDSLKCSELQLNESKISIGDSLSFSFDIASEETTKVRIEYAIDYVKSRGSRTRKVFKITETTLSKGTKHYTKTQQFEDLTTRKHYEGLHTLSIIVNGEIKRSVDFFVNV